MSTNASSLSASRLFSVKSKVVLVTGGAKGIGNHITRAYLENGAKVYIAARERKALEAQADSLNAEARSNTGWGSVVPLAADLSTREGCYALAAQLAAQETKLHVLVNNSGANWGAPLSSYPDQAWDKVLALNLKGPFHLTVAVLSLLEAASTPEDPARVINIGSVNGMIAPMLETYAYSTSKAGLHMLTKHLALRLARSNITVNALACGPFESKMMKATLENHKDVILSGVALHRLGEASDIGGCCLFLSSLASSYITGAIIPCDGGSLIKSAL